MRERVAVIKAELELGETTAAYMVAADLELDLEGTLGRIEPDLGLLARAA